MPRAALFVLFAAAALTAQEPEPKKPAKVEAGLKGGDVPSAFRAFLVWDKRYPTTITKPTKPGELKVEEPEVRNRSEKPHCLVCANGLNPVVAVFAPKIPTDASDKLSKLLQAIDAAARARKEASFGGAAFFLVLDKETDYSDARREMAKQAALVGESGGLVAVPVGLAEKKSAATAAWKLDGQNAEAVTVVFYHRLKVIERWTFPDGQPTDDDVKAILAAIEKEVPVKK